jgi:hypothetical protein
VSIGQMTWHEARLAEFQRALPTTWQEAKDAESKITAKAEAYLAGKVKPEYISEAVLRWLLEPDRILIAIATSSGNP